MNQTIFDHRFTGKREWGLNPAGMPCQYRVHLDGGGFILCGFTIEAHRIPCGSSLNIKGEHFSCDWPTDLQGKHEGWAHTNKKAQAVWGEGRLNVGEEYFREAVCGVKNAVDIETQIDVRKQLRDFIVWVAGNDGIVAMTDPKTGVYITFSEIADTYVKLKESGSGV